MRQILTSPPPAKKEIASPAAQQRMSHAGRGDWPQAAIQAAKAVPQGLPRDKSAGFWPVFALLDWIGTEFPTAPLIAEAALKTDPHSTAMPSDGQRSQATSERSAYRADPLARSRGEFHARNIDRGFVITYWKDKLDEKLRFDFGWRICSRQSRRPLRLVFSNPCAAPRWPRRETADFRDRIRGHRCTS
jgi:hypothetical protein